MLTEPQDQLERETLLELDRRAWNLPTPPVAPAGPVRDVWPVYSSLRSPRREDARAEDPAAA